MLITGFRCGYKTSRLEPEAFRLNVGNLTTEYQYAAALRGIPLNKLRRTRRGKRSLLRTMERFSQSALHTPCQ